MAMIASGSAPPEVSLGQLADRLRGAGSAIDPLAKAMMAAYALRNPSASAGFEQHLQDEDPQAWEQLQQAEGRGAAQLGDAERWLRQTPEGVGRWFTDDIPAAARMAGSFLGTFADSPEERAQAGRKRGEKIRGALSQLADVVKEKGVGETATQGWGAIKEGVRGALDERGYAALLGPENIFGGKAAGLVATTAGRLLKAAPKVFKVVEAPKNTITVYKLLKKKKDGSYYPLFVDADAEIPVGEWLEAVAGETVKGGKVKSRLGPLANRPGWHSSKTPAASHIGGISTKGANKVDYRPAHQVWAKVEVGNDVDWQSKANELARRNKEGTIVPGTAQITEEAPYGGYYAYRTNPNQANAWVISGEMRILGELDPGGAARHGDLPSLPQVIEQKNLSFDDLASSTKKELKEYYPELHRKMTTGEVPEQTVVSQSQPETGVLAELGRVVGEADPAAPTVRVGAGDDLLSGVSTDVGYQKTPGYTAGERISTRYPTAKGRTEDPLLGDLVIDTDVLRRDESMYKRTGEVLGKYPNIQRDIELSGDADRVINAMKEHSKMNLNFIFDEMPAEIRDRAMMWYDGANQIANQFKSRYNVSLESASAVIAALSPQMDWFKNVTLAERVLDTMHNKAGMRWTAEMDDFLVRFHKAPTKKRGKDWRPFIDSIRGKSLQDIEDPTAKAIWIRAFDETTRGRNYRIITPEGDFSSIAKNNDGSSTLAGWGSFADIAKAVSVIENPSVANISRSMGLQHKVRNFYNNIADPRALHGDVTMDTHAVSASLLRPLGASSTEVLENLGGGPSTGLLGVSGSPYAVHADAYREAAAGRGVLPREMQSITWEGVRGLYSPEQKRSKAFVAPIEELFSQYKEGKIPLENVQQKVLELAGGITPPEWAR